MSNEKVSWEQSKSESEIMPESTEPNSLFDAVLEDIESSTHRAVDEWNLEGKPLGSGGYGVAYLATKTRTIGPRSISIRGAIKLVDLDQNFSMSQVQSLVDELTKLSKIHSRYIANLIDAGTFMTSRGYLLPYFVMDYIEGDDLAKIIYRISTKKQPAMQPALFKNLALNTLRGLLTAHEAKVLHIDIKPANIMFSSKDETFVLIDFGVSKFVEHDILDGFYGGTPGYVAPEVYLQKASRASDVFSLGLTFYETLTLQHPFKDMYRSMLRNNPNMNPKDTRVMQEITKNMEFDFELLTEDQRALIEPMLHPDQLKRPSVDQLIETAERLVTPNNSSPEISLGNIASDIYDSWEQMGSHISNLIKNQGLAQAHIVVDDTEHLRLWFKTQTSGDQIAIYCPTPKNTIALGKLGWKPEANGMHLKEVNHSVEEVTEAILKAMKIGLSLKPPVSVTRGHSS